MKLNRADGTSLVAIGAGAFVAVLVTSLFARADVHVQKIHIERVAPVERVERVDRVVIESEVSETDGQRVRIVGGSAVESGPQPLMYVDGVRVEGTRETALADIDPSTIDRIEVVKGEAAMRLFGDEATGGVIQIFLKEPGAADPGG